MTTIESRTITDVQDDAPSTLDERAADAVIAHHAELRRGLYERVMALRDEVCAGARWDVPLAALTAYLATVILPHAAAEEATLYPPLAADPRGALFVDAMLLDHERLTEQTRALANACERQAALALAEAAAALFALHATKENELLLPALQGLDRVSLAALVTAMHDRLGE